MINTFIYLKNPSQSIFLPDTYMFYVWAMYNSYFCHSFCHAIVSGVSFKIPNILIFQVRESSVSHPWRHSPDIQPAPQTNYIKNSRGGTLTSVIFKLPGGSNVQSWLKTTTQSRKWPRAMANGISEYMVVMWSYLFHFNSAEVFL